MCYLSSYRLLTEELLKIQKERKDKFDQQQQKQQKTNAESLIVFD